jgi:hypothetical protein
MRDFLLHALAASRATWRDVTSTLPWTQSEADIAHIERVAQEDPYRFFLSDLPSLGKCYDRWLSTGVLSSVPESCIMDNGAVLILSAILRPGASVDDLNVLGSDQDPNEVFFIRQLAYMFKRTVVECPREDSDSAAREFWSVDQGLRAHRTRVGFDSLEVVSGPFAEGLSSGSHRRLVRLVRVLDLLSGWLTPPRELDLYSVVPKHGPGAVSDLQFGRDKYSFPSWGAHLYELFPPSFFASANEGLPYTVGVTGERPKAKLIAVPKSYRKPRLIASEPVVHQFLQQGLMRWIREHMHPIHRRSVDFNSQQPSRDAALRASATGKFATVDLSAASDRLSLWVVESFFRKHPLLLESLIVTRSDSVVDPITNQEGCLRKFAPMGSAVTFPVQSLVYATVAYAAVLVHNGWDLKSHSYMRKKLKQVADSVRVFGDDILLPSEAVPNLGVLLEFLQLKVNGSKSHYDGYFRESCGMDAYKGYDVTPAYISHIAPSDPTTTLEAYVEQSNNAWRKGLWHLATWMKNEIRPQVRRLIPISNEVLGCVTLVTFCRGTRAVTRHSTGWQRDVVRGYFPRATAKRARRDSWCSLLQYFLERPDPDSNWRSGWDTKRKSRLGLRWEDSVR